MSKREATKDNESSLPEEVESGTAGDAAPVAETGDEPVQPEFELEKVTKERDDNYSRYLRAVADLENYRRRVMREKDELRQFAILNLVESLLPVYEHLGLAIASAEQAQKPEDIARGVAMVLEQFRSALATVGLDEINPEVGAEFDPHQHESLSHAPSDTIPEEKIVQIIRTGFSLKGRIIRPASVLLSSGPAKAAEDQPEQ